jgi:hypothetical protein
MKEFLFASFVGSMKIRSKEHQPYDTLELEYQYAVQEAVMFQPEQHSGAAQLTEPCAKLNDGSTPSMTQCTTRTKLNDASTITVIQHTTSSSSAVTAARAALATSEVTASGVGGVAHDINTDTSTNPGLFLLIGKTSVKDDYMPVGPSPPKLGTAVRRKIPGSDQQPQSQKKQPTKCQHGKQRCKECGGSGLCEHGRRRSRCKECGGGR